MAKPKTSKQFAAKIRSLKGEIAKLEKEKKAAAAKRKAPKKRKAPAKKRRSPKKRKR